MALREKRQYYLWSPDQASIRIIAVIPHTSCSSNWKPWFPLTALCPSSVFQLTVGCSFLWLTVQPRASGNTRFQYAAGIGPVKILQWFFYFLLFNSLAGKKTTTTKSTLEERLVEKVPISPPKKQTNGNTKCMLLWILYSQNIFQIVKLKKDQQSATFSLFCRKPGASSWKQLTQIQEYDLKSYWSFLSRTKYQSLKWKNHQKWMKYEITENVFTLIPMLPRCMLSSLLLCQEYNKMQKTNDKK